MNNNWGDLASRLSQLRNKEGAGDSLHALLIRRLHRGVVFTDPSEVSEDTRNKVESIVKSFEDGVVSVNDDLEEQVRELKLRVVPIGIQFKNMVG